VRVEKYFRFVGRIFANVCLSSLVLTANVQAKDADKAGFAGIEYYGSSQITKLELQKMLGLRTGASPEAIENALLRLKKQLDARHIDAHAEVVTASPGVLYVVVDVSDSSVEEAPTRRLKMPHHVNVRTEKPFLLLQDLNNRLDDLRNQGRPATESLKDGYKYYSDEPADQVVTEILKYAPVMRDELIAVTESDPNPIRRSQAIDLLGWSGTTDDTAMRLMPALDDMDPFVRASVARYLFPRLSLLSAQFPFENLAQAFSRQITRPSHEDRSKGLYCLLSLCLQHRELVKPIAEADEKCIRDLADTTTLPSVKTPADKLLAMFAEDANKRQQTNLPWMR